MCVDVPKLTVDRPFTYLLPEDFVAGVGSPVSVPFHGRTVKGWILGPAVDVPPGRLLPVRSVRSAVRFFDHHMLGLLRWVGERYIAPLATVIDRSHPPRVASEETAEETAASGAPSVRPSIAVGAGTTTWLRPLPGEEASECVRHVDATLRAGRRAVVLVPEAEPLPETGRAVLEAFGPRAAAFIGGEARERYRMWLDILAGRFDVVVGTRPAVFAPVSNLGLMWISREAHPGHREERSPSYHVRDVAMARARLDGADCVLCSLSPSVETMALAAQGAIAVVRPPRQVERARAPLVETTTPEAEDRSARLGRLLREAGSAALVVSRRGYGVARVCRTCGAPAACAACGGPIVARSAGPSCSVCGTTGNCAACGGSSFGIERGGTERIAEWAGHLARVPVELGPERGPPTPPQRGTVLVGTAAAVKEWPTAGLDLVAILDPDRALSRPGIHAGERALATWMEASAWARPRAAGGRVLVQTRTPGHPAIQALVRWEPEPYLRAEAEARARAGFPPGHPVFRILGTSDLLEELEALEPETLLSTASSEGTVCLLAVRPGRLEALRATVLRLVAEGRVTRVEAEPQL